MRAIHHIDPTSSDPANIREVDIRENLRVSHVDFTVGVSPLLETTGWNTGDGTFDEKDLLDWDKVRPKGDRISVGECKNVYETYARFYEAVLKSRLEAQVSEKLVWSYSRKFP